MDDAAGSAARYSRDATLNDGTRITIRAIRPDDRARLLRHFNRLSAESVYFRFFGLKRTLTDGDLDYLTRLDFVDHVGLAAVVIEDGEEIFVGVARYITNSAAGGRRAAEAAFAVVDEFQGRGIGTQLLACLAEIGRDQGVGEFTADVMGTNRKMLEVFEKSGYEVHERGDSGVIHVRFPIVAGSTDERGSSTRT